MSRDETSHGSGMLQRHDSLSKTVVQGRVEAGRRRGLQRKGWKDNVKEWTFLPMSELLAMASHRKTNKQTRQTKLLEDLVPYVPPTTQSVERLN